MASSALENWKEHRAKHLDELVEAHTTLGGEGPGRRWRTEQLNLSLVLRLAIEFQGFSRELHEVGAEQFARWTVPNDARLQQIVSTLITIDRQMDKGNASKDRLSSDFNRFGLRWWPTLEARDSQTSKRLAQLERINKARNAIAHDLQGSIVELRKDGYPLTFTTFGKWRRSLSALAVKQWTMY